MPQTVVLPRQVALISGVVEAGSVLRFYRTNTTTPQSVYTDSALTNPVTSSTADAAGVFQKLYYNPAADFDYRITLEDSSGVISYTEDGISRVPASALEIGAALYDIDDTESGVGLTRADLDLRFKFGELERFRMLGDGTTDDSAGLSNAALVSAQGVRLLGGGPSKNYCIRSTITCGSTFDLDLQGAKISPVGNFSAFSRNPTGTAATTSSAIASGATEGSRSIVVSSASGFAVGQLCIFDSNHADYQSASWPCNWATITSIAGTTIEIDRPLGCEYEATATMYAYNQSLFGQLFRIKGQIDMVDSTYAGNGAAVDISGYRVVDLRDCEILNAEQSDTGSTTVQTLSCLDVYLSGKSLNTAIAGNVWDIQGSRSVFVSELHMDGAGFGLNIYRASDVVINGVIMNGRRKYELDESVTATRSVRGIKLIGCLDANIACVALNDYSSPFKFESNRRVNVSNFTMRNAGGESGDIGVNFSGFGTVSKQKGGNISNFNISNMLGAGSAIGFNNPDTGRYKVTNGTIRKAVQNMIYAESSSFITCSDLELEDWGTTSGTCIRADGGGSFVNITFRNSDNTKVCFSAPVASKTYYFKGINSPSGCPIFPSSKKFRNKGTATIPSGATSIVVNHELCTTPAITDFILVPAENPTNDPGNIWVSTLTSTQFTINCRADPGASNYDIAWDVDLCRNGPFTMPP